MKNEVIDLVDDAVVVGGGSPLSSISSSMQQHQQLQYRKGRAGRNALGIPSDNNIPAIDLETSPPAAPHRPKKKMTADSRSSGSNVIDLEAAPNSPASSVRKRGRNNNNNNERNGNEVTRMQVTARDKNSSDSRKIDGYYDDVIEIRHNDVIEILSPAAAAAVAKSGAMVKKRQKRNTTPLLYDLSKSNNLIDRIREVFPLVSRQKVQSFLDKASSYCTSGSSNIYSSYCSSSPDEEDVIQIVMSVLSEHPTGRSIPEESFAAAAVGGYIDGCSIAAASTTTTESNTNENAKATTPELSAAAAAAATIVGKRKIAQLECNCCYVEYPFEEMVSCRQKGHLFCKTCLQKHTEQRVFGQGNLGVKNNIANSSRSSSRSSSNSNSNSNSNNNPKSNTTEVSKALEILCMHSSGCTSGFHEVQLRKALSDKVRKKYDEMQYAAVIESANKISGDISKCPKCNYIAFAEKSFIIFHCPQCSFKSCRECGDEAHPGIKCDEVETKTETDGRKYVEEAMTQALVRTCPRPFCRKKFLKTDGCNKMTCACGAFVCYVCRREISPHVAYGHFCQVPHCNHKSCGKCALFADVEKDDAKRVREAAKEAAKKQKTAVDVELLLKNPNPISAPRRRRPPSPPPGGRGVGGGNMPAVGNNVQVHIDQLHQQLVLAQQQMQQAQLQMHQARQQFGGGRGGNNGHRREQRRRAR